MGFITIWNFFLQFEQFVNLYKLMEQGVGLLLWNCYAGAGAGRNSTLFVAYWAKMDNWQYFIVKHEILDEVRKDLYSSVEGLNLSLKAFKYLHLCTVKFFWFPFKIHIINSNFLNRLQLQAAF